MRWDEIWDEIKFIHALYNINTYIHINMKRRTQNKSRNSINYNTHRILHSHTFWHFYSYQKFLYAVAWNCQKKLLYNISKTQKCTHWPVLVRKRVKQFTSHITQTLLVRRVAMYSREQAVRVSGLITVINAAVELPSVSIYKTQNLKNVYIKKCEYFVMFKDRPAGVSIGYIVHDANSSLLENKYSTAIQIHRPMNHTKSHLRVKIWIIKSPYYVKATWSF